MRRLFNLIALGACLLLGVLPCLPAKKNIPEVDIVETTAARQGDLIQVDARVKNLSLKPLRKLQVIFRFEADQNTVVTTQRIGVDEAVLQPGQESEVHGQLKDTPRAVQFQVAAVDSRGIELVITNSGPFPIE